MEFLLNIPNVDIKLANKREETARMMALKGRYSYLNRTWVRDMRIIELLENAHRTRRLDWTVEVLPES